MMHDYMQIDPMACLPCFLLAVMSLIVDSLVGRWGYWMPAFEGRLSDRVTVTVAVGASER